MGERIRAMDWSKTSLGPVDGWPQSLRSALSHLLPSKAQIAMFWGPDLVTLYNDAYRPVFGGKHPAALGAPIREAWAELWSSGLKELFDSVLTTGEAFWAQDLPFFLERHGYPEETYFDVSYDPVRDESGRVSGVFCIVSETTGRVVGERRLRLLRDLGGIAQQASSVSDVFTTAATVLARDPARSPVRPLLRPSRRWGSAALVGACGVEAGDPVAPRELGSSERARWPLASVARDLRDRGPGVARSSARGTVARADRTGRRRARARPAGSRPRRGSWPASARAGGPTRRTATSCGWSGPTSRRRWRRPAAPRTSVGAPRCSPSSIARRRRSSATSATSSAPRSRSSPDPSKTCCRTRTNRSAPPSASGSRSPGGTRGACRSWSTRCSTSRASRRAGCRRATSRWTWPR